MEYNKVYQFVYCIKSYSPEARERIVDTTRKLVMKMILGVECHYYIIRHQSEANSLIHCHVELWFKTEHDRLLVADRLAQHDSRLYFIKASNVDAPVSYFIYVHHEMTNIEKMEYCNHDVFDKKQIFFPKNSIEFVKFQKKYLTKYWGLMGVEQSEGLPERSEDNPYTHHFTE